MLFAQTMRRPRIWDSKVMVDMLVIPNARCWAYLKQVAKIPLILRCFWLIELSSIETGERR